MIEEALAVPPARQTTDPLEQVLLEALERFPRSARSSISYVKDDRLLRYDAAAGTLAVGTRSMLWAQLQTRANEATARRALKAAALSEINRALVAVTDAEERRALVELFGRT